MKNRQNLTTKPVCPKVKMKVKATSAMERMMWMEKATSFQMDLPAKL